MRLAEGMGGMKRVEVRQRAELFSMDWPCLLYTSIGDARPHGADFRRGVAEQRTEQQHFEDHTAYDSGVAHGRVEAVRLDPVQGTLLTTRSGDGEGHGRFRPPAGDAPDDPADEDNRGQQRPVSYTHLVEGCRFFHEKLFLPSVPDGGHAAQIQKPFGIALKREIHRLFLFD